MTSRRFLATSGLLLAATFVTALPAMAQQGPPPAGAPTRGPGGDARRGPPTVDARVQRLTTELGLSPEQATKVRAALTAERRQADSILAARANRQDAERAAMMAVRTSTEKSVSAVLTAEQRTKHDAMRARGGRDGRGPGMRGGARHRDGDDRRDRRGRR
ncbi:MAG: hypothetical protein V4813_12420 [Gemmatimonadota bacterium]